MKMWFFGLFVLWVNTTFANDFMDLVDANIKIKENPEWLDFIIQDVCVDGNDQIVVGDPRDCSRRRNIMIGEKLPYVMSDWQKGINKRYQGVFSYPVVTESGELGVVVAKIFGFGDEGVGPFNFDFNKLRDGFDLINLDSEFVASSRTSDGGCFDQLISGASGRHDGWILFPKTLGDGTLHHTTKIDRISLDRPSQCLASSVSEANTVMAIWNRPSIVTFENGANLFSIVAYHVAHFDLARTQNAMERTFWTREYGWTRWEAWIPLDRCELENGVGSVVCNPDLINNALFDRCNPVTPVPARAIWGGKNWVRIDCRDNSFYQLLDKPLIPVHTQMARQNGVIDIKRIGLEQDHGVAGESPPVQFELPGGTWSWSCQNVKVEGRYLEIDCLDVRSVPVHNKIDLSICKNAHNIDGKMVCTE